MTPDAVYQIALTLVPNIGNVHAKSLIEIFGDAASIFNAKKSTLEKIEGIGTVRANSIKAFTDFTSCEAELDFIERYKIAPTFFNQCQLSQTAIELLR